MKKSGLIGFFLLGQLCSCTITQALFSPLLDITKNSVDNNGNPLWVKGSNGKLYQDGFLVMPVLTAKGDTWVRYARLPVYLQKDDEKFYLFNKATGYQELAKGIDVSKSVEKVKLAWQKKDFSKTWSLVEKWRQADEKAGRIFRIDLFHEVMGTYEIEFRRWDTNKEPIWADYPPLEELRKTKDGFLQPQKDEDLPFGRRALTGSRFNQFTVKELQDTVKKEQATYQSQGLGSFSLIDGYKIIKEVGLEEALRATDIAYLQETNPGALFQIASTFNALEGGMGKDLTNYGRLLEGMQKAPTQGESATLSAMGAAIIRKYVVPPVNLLDGLKDDVEMDKSAARNGVVWLLKRDLDAEKDCPLVKVGLHRDVVITSGYYGCYSEKLKDSFSKTSTLAQERIPFLVERNVVLKDREPFFIFNKWLDLTDDQKLIRVDQLFTAALMLRDDPKNPRAARRLTEQNAKVLLEASYKGTMYAAAMRAMERRKAGQLQGAQKVYLTLVGAGAFGNKIAWIVDILKAPWFSALIRDFDLAVYLVVYPSTRADRKMADDDYKLLVNDLPFFAPKGDGNLVPLAEALKKLSTKKGVA